MDYPAKVRHGLNLNFLELKEICFQDFFLTY